MDDDKNISDQDRENPKPFSKKELIYTSVAGAIFGCILGLLLGNTGLYTIAGAALMAGLYVIARKASREDEEASLSTGNRFSAGVLLAVAVLCSFAGAGIGLALGSYKAGAIYGCIAGLILYLIGLINRQTGGAPISEIKPDSANTKEKRRNHVICIDGTWNEPGKPTNVRKIYNLAEPATQPDDKSAPDRKSNEGTEGNKQLPQIARYYTGVGISESHYEGPTFSAEGHLSNLLGGGAGYGAKAILQRTYCDFVQSYRPGDQIFIFGFSRGAAIARMLASTISKHGVPEKLEIRTLRNLTKRDAVVETKIIGSGKCGRPNIKMLGVWDTVAAFGVPWNKIELFKTDNLKLAEKVDYACHLIAVDEVRKAFDITLFDESDRVEEVWFPGAHTNVGGGWQEDEKLSDLALNFMCKRAKEKGLALADPPATGEKNVSGAIWKPGRLWLWRIARQVRVQRDSEPSSTPPRIHQSVFEKKKTGSTNPDETKEPYDPPNVKELGYTEEELTHNA